MSGNNLQKQDIPSLYALKALCALFVVIIHIPLVGKDFISPVIRIAVPCFYMISGYFLYSGISQKETEKAWKWAKKAFVLAFVLSLFYITATIIYKGGRTSLFAFFEYLITGWGHLWYLTALWQGLLLFIIIRKYLPSYFIYFIPLLCVFNLFLGRYYFLFDSGDYSLPMHMTLNCISVTLPYVCLGYIIKKYISIILAMKGWLIFLFLSVCFIYTEEYILNLFLCNNNAGYTFFTLPLSLCCFIVFLKDIKSVPSFVIRIGKKHSANIYYFHFFVSGIVGIIFGPKLLNIDIVSVRAIIVFVANIIFSAALLFSLTVFSNLIKRIKKQKSFV